METSTPEVVVTEKKRDVRGHRIYDNDYKKRVVDGWAKSGLTQKAYARKEGIHYSTLVWWLQCLRPAQAAPKPTIKFAQVQAPIISPEPQYTEAILPDGTHLRGRSVSELAELIRLVLR